MMEHATSGPGTPEPATPEHRDSGSSCIAIATYKRPESLLRTLTAVANNNFAGHTVHDLVVIDNDPAQTAKSTVENFAETWNGSIHYLSEVEPGVVAVRNRAVAFARELAATFLLFTDDDSEPKPDWAASLLNTALEFDADAVVGALIFDAPDSPDWLINSSQLAPVGSEPGTPSKAIHAGNCCLRLRSLPDEEPFHLSLSQTGGEDTFLGMSLVNEGKRVVWSDAAIVEHLDASRTVFRWHAERSIRSGCIFAIIDGHINGNRTHLRHLASGASKILSLPRVAVPLLRRNRGGAADIILNSLMGVGLVTGSFGLVLDYYQVKRPSFRRLKL